MSPARIDVFRIHFGDTPERIEYVARRVIQALRDERKIDTKVLDVFDSSEPSIERCRNFQTLLSTISTGLHTIGLNKEAEALERALQHATEVKEQGGLGLDGDADLDEATIEKLMFSVEGWLSSITAAEKAYRPLLALTVKPHGRRPMTLSQKILAHHAIGRTDPSGLSVGDVIRVSVDWIIASEISWTGMKKALDPFGDYNIWRNDRFWLAGDHVVDPRNYETELSKKLIDTSEKTAKQFKLTDYKGPNYTIIHTEFVRSRAEPGMIAIGSDSHTCSSGAVGCLAIGLGAADVAMPLVTGETWFKVPEAISVRFVGEPAPGIGGKDTILYILGELKRNTVAADRVVEFSGPSVKYLSVDARFAISNMCTEFGAITGIFVADAITQSYISQRKAKSRRSSSLYFQPDSDAKYAETFDIDLSRVASFFAIYPDPDNVVPVSSKLGMPLDGCFIGACTTTLEDLILGALVLEVGMRDYNLESINKSPTEKGGRPKRHVVPGSLPVRSALDDLGLLKVYEEAGFEIGVPGCSFCVGMGSDQAQVGEVWLSSQNRNFKNRMGKGSFGNIASAATVAASSFSMRVTDPAEFLEKIDMEYYDKIRGHSNKQNDDDKAIGDGLKYVEPALRQTKQSQPPFEEQARTPKKGADEMSSKLEEPIIKSRVVRLGEFVDTDALAPAQACIDYKDPEDLGSHCLEYTHPEFREKVKQGQKVIVGGKAFGCGSSREEAVIALNGAGVKAVVAPSFAFIYSRNQPNLGLLGIVIPEKETDFYELAIEDAGIEIDIPRRCITVTNDGKTREFNFQLTDLEIALLANKGLATAYGKFRGNVFKKLTGSGVGEVERKARELGAIEDEEEVMEEELQW